MFPTVNRVRKSLLFRSSRVLDWLHDADPTSLTLTLQGRKPEPTIYLLPGCEDDQDLVAHLKNYCDTIFEEELDAWYREQSTWPVDRDFKTLSLWFEYRAHTMLLDLCDGPLRRD